jgi:hypothetical protein
MVHHKSPSRLSTRRTQGARYLPQKVRQKLFMSEVRLLCSRRRKFGLAYNEPGAGFSPNLLDEFVL